MRELTRRDFLGSGLAAAAAVSASTATGCRGPQAPRVSAEAAALHRESAVIDLHLDSLIQMRLLGYDLGTRHTNRLPTSPFSWHMDLPRAREGGLDGAVMGVVTNPREVSDDLIAPLRLAAWIDDARGIDQTLETLELLDATARRLPAEMTFCRSGSEMRAAIDAGRFAALAGLEGAHGIEDDMENVRKAHTDGLRMLGLVHFQSSAAAHPMTVATFDGQGLTPFGFELIDEMRSLRMVVDLAHVNYAGVDDALDRLTQPFVVSHTGCRALQDFRRNLEDDHIRRIADHGGVIGLCLARSFVGRPGVEGFVDHLEHALKIGGEDCVALGSDWDGAIVPVEGLGDVTGLPRVTDVLLARGVPPGSIQKMLGENALRVITDVCG
jgi:membrane dipeptidase